MPKRHCNSLYSAARTTLTILATMVLLSAAGPAATAEDPLKTELEKRLGEALHQPVKVETYALSFDPPRATLRNLVVGEPAESADGHPLAQIPVLEVDYVPSALLGGEMRFTEMRFQGTKFHVGVDENGRSTFERFLQRMLDPDAKTKDKGKAGGLPSLGNLRFTGTTLTFYAPKKVAAPDGRRRPGPLTVTAERLVIKNLSPTPPQLKEKEAQNAKAEKPAAPDPWIVIDFKGLAVRAPLINVEARRARLPDGRMLDEGLAVDQGTAQILWENEPRALLKARAVRLAGLWGLSHQPGAGENETLARIARTLRAGLLGAEETPQGGDAQTSVLVQDLTVERSALEFSALAPDGNQAYWRLSELYVDVENFGVGPAASVPASTPGHLVLRSTTASSEDAGEFSLEWNELYGSYPELTFAQRFKMTGLALPAMNTRMGSKRKDGFASGHLDAAFRGRTERGNLDWKGHLTVSPDATLADEDDADRKARALQRVATGVPVEPVRVRGTLQDPEVELPDYAKHAFGEVLHGISSSGVGKFFRKTFGVVGDVVKGVGEGTKEVIKHVPVIGDIFGD